MREFSKRSVKYSRKHKIDRISKANFEKSQFLKLVYFKSKFLKIYYYLIFKAIFSCSTVLRNRVSTRMW